MIDGSWFAIFNTEDIQIEQSRLLDLGNSYHEVFNSQLTLFLQNGSTLGNHIVT